MYVPVHVNYMCATCGWFATVIQPQGYYLQILCPIKDDGLLEIVDSHGN